MRLNQKSSNSKLSLERGRGDVLDVSAFPRHQICALEAELWHCQHLCAEHLGTAAGRMWLSKPWDICAQPKDWELC